MEETLQQFPKLEDTKEQPDNTSQTKEMPEPKTIIEASENKQET